MATVLHSESSRLYSWWWDSHISPKNSRWLQENLTDMDLKVKAMIKLIEEDADSFARRAEMYYKKRPELMKLVEEFYRAYRALAERYDHATVELRQAHRTMAEAFPNQVPFMLAECSPSGSSLSGSEPQTPEMLHIKRSLLDPDDFHKDALGLSLLDLHAIKRNETFTDQSDSGLGKKGLKQLKLMLGSAEIPSNSELAEVGVSEVLIPAEDERERSLLDAYFLSSEENSNLKTEILSERDDKTKSIVENLKEALGKIKAEKQVLFLQYQQNLERLACLDKELNYAQNDAKTLNERAFKAETEVKTLREALDTLEAERDAGLIEHNQSLEKIANLETMVSQAHRDATGLIERATKAETEVRNLKLELSRVEAEKEAALLQYKLCLEKLATLEDKILHAENDAKKLIDQTDRAENEVRLLRQALTESREEKETLAVLHKQCQATISELERETRRSQEDAKRLNSELLTGLEKLKYAEEQFRKLESLNQSLQLEVENLAKKMVMKDQELLQKHEELEKLQFCVQNEHSRLLQVEATLQTLQQLHSKSQEDHQALVSEVKNGLQLLKDSEKYKQDLEREIQRVNKENRGLNDLNLSSTILIRDMQNEAYNLRKTKGKLEEKVAEQLDQIKALQRDIYHLKEEIKGLNRRYQALVEQLELVGLNPDSVLSSVKSLQDENLQLEESWKRDRDEKEVLLKKVEDMGLLLEKKAVLESSLSDVTGKLEEAREKVKSFQESYQILLGEKSILVAEKSALFSQLQIVTENMQKLLQKNSCLEDSFSAASAELEGLRTKSKSLEESCHLLSNEKSNLLNEREKLVAQLEIVEQRLENLEKRFAVLEEKYAGMEKEKEHTLHQVEELQASLGLEKQERTNFMQSSEARLVGLENHIYLLQEESKSRRKEFEEELDKAVNAQVEIFILQRLLQDMEENNLCLLIECQKYKEAYELSEKLISELEGDNLEQQVELEFVLDEIKVLKGGIYSMIMALESDQANGCKNETETEQISQISRSIEHMKSSILRIEDEKLQLLVENSVIYTLFEELRLEGKKLKSENEIIKLNFKSFKEQFAALLCEKSTLVVENGQLMLEISESDHREEVRKAEVERLLQKLVDLQHNYNELERGKFKANEENASLLKDYLKLEEEKCLLEEENYSIFQEAISCNNLSFYYSCFGTEKVAELEALADDLDNLQCINSDLKMEVELLGKKLELKETENSDLKESVEMLEEKSNQFQLWEVEAASFYFDLQISTVREVLYENKVQDLTIVCENLEDESALKNAELELIKERVGYLEGEVGRLNTELSAYNPIICSLRDNIVSLEQNALFRIKHNGESYQELRDVEVDVDLHGDDYESQEDRTAVVSDKISDLQNMQERIEAVEKAVIQGMEELAKQESINTNAKLEAAMKEIEELRSENRFYQQKLSLQGRAHGDEMQGDFDLQKTEPGRNWVLMKDIPLDRVSNCSFHGITRVNTVGSDDPMLVLWETADQDHRRDPSVHDTQKEASLAIDGDIVLDQTEDIEQKSGHASSEVQLEKELSVDKLEVPTRVAPSYEYVNKRNVLERVASDSQRLHTLQSTVQELKKKMEANKKTKKGKNSEYVTIEEQLQETEEAVAELVEINAQLTKDIEELEDDASTGLEDTGNAQRQDVLEQAQKGSEKIGRLQLEVQKIQYILLKLKDEKKSKGTSRFPNNRISKASGLFRSFAYSGGKKKKGCFCGGSRPSSPGGDHGF